MPDSDVRFNPTRLSLARRRRGLTKSALSEMLGVDRRSIAGFENGEYSPSQITISKLEQSLGFPIDFFFGEDLDEPSPDSASFRSMSKMTAAQRDIALSEGTLALHLSRWLEERFSLPDPQLPDLSREESPEAAAMTLRHGWGWGELPIPNMVHLLESKGVRIFSLTVDSREVDAFSMWKGTMPFVFLNTLKSSEHSRFDAAHELGHLVLHRHGVPQGRETEREADEFASSFLMPRGSILASAPRFPILATLVSLKHVWNVSVAALAHRLHSLGLISDWHYRGLAIEIAEKGYRTNEPEPSRPEASQVLAKVFSTLHSDGISRQDLADSLGISTSELSQLIFGLAISDVPSIDESLKAPSPPRAVQLKLIQ